METPRQSRVIGALEAQTILGISRSKLHALATSGELVGRLVDRRGQPRHWRFMRSDVLGLLASGGYLRQRPKRRKQKQLWEEYYGAIPAGFTPAFRDGNRANDQPRNLCLIPLRAPKGPRRSSGRVTRIEWTKERLAFLRRAFPNRTALELAAELGISKSAVHRQAQRLHLRKRSEFLRHHARIANQLPLGTERVHEHTNSVWLKISLDGKPYEQWRPKQQVVWEQANSQKVRKGCCVIFKDGDKRNFNPENLALISRRERAAQGFAEFLSQPQPLQRLVKLNAKLGREIEKRRSKRVEPRSSAPVRKRHVTEPRRWSAEMDEVLSLGYPTMPVEQLIKTLGVSLSSLRQRARRLQIRRSPETIIAEARAASSIHLHQEHPQ